MATELLSVGAREDPIPLTATRANGGLALKTDGTKYLIANTDEAAIIYWAINTTTSQYDGLGLRANLGVAMGPTRLGGGAVENSREFTLKSGEHLFFFGLYQVTIASTEL